MTYLIRRRPPTERTQDARTSHGSWGLSSLRFIPSGTAPIGQAGAGYGAGAGAGAGATGTSPCAPCPTGCTTVTKNETYYARKTRQSASDIPVTMNRRIIKCEDVSSLPRTSCQDEIAQIKAQYGLSGMSLNGLSGCSSCSGGYSNRM